MRRLTCFVIMPFGKKDTSEHTHYIDVFNNVIKSAVIKTGKVADEFCYRVDLIDKPGSILKDIVCGLIKADIVIADLTKQNPNVLYELGIRHSSRRFGTILVASDIECIPFHLRNYRIAIYNDIPNVGANPGFDAQINGCIESILSDTGKTDSPVFDILPELASYESKATNITISFPIGIYGSPTQSRHIYELYMHVDNKNFNEITPQYVDIYLPSFIPIEWKALPMEELELDMALEEYRRYRFSSFQKIGPQRKASITLCRFIISTTAYIGKKIFYKYYDGENSPLQGQNSLEGYGRVNF